MDAFFIGALRRSRYVRFSPPVMPDTERVTEGHFSALLIDLDSMSTYTRLACGTISVSEVSEIAILDSLPLCLY